VINQINGTTFNANGLGDVKPIIEIGGKDPSAFVPNIRHIFTQGTDKEKYFINLNGVDDIANGAPVNLLDGVISQEIDGVKHEYYIDKNGHFKWDKLFNSCPDSMQVRFKVKKSLGIRFVYQDTLENDYRNDPEWKKLYPTLEDFLKSKTRPENIVGSYAVYCDKQNDYYKLLHEKADIFNIQLAAAYPHKYKVDDQSRFYELLESNKTGKLMHLPCPFVVHEATGKREWAGMVYEEIDDTTGLLIITMPEKFMREADYSLGNVRLDPELGYHTAGASWDGPATGYALYGNYTNQATEDGTAQHVYGYFRYQTSSQDTSLGYYNSEASLPHTFIDSGNVTVDSATGDWFGAVVTGSIVDNSYYIPALLTQSRLQQAYDSGSHDDGYYSTNSSFINDPSVGYPSVRWSMYLEYGSAATNTITGSHTLGGLTQTGSISIGESNNLSGSHTFGGLNQTGSLTQISLITKLGLLSNKRMWFAHQSVGNYMTHGPADNDAYGVGRIAAAEGYITVVSEPADIGDIARGAFAESYNGTNFYPYDKLSDFDYAIRNTFSGGYLDFAIFKFCWVDFFLENSEIKTTGQADTFWTTYKSTIDDLIGDFPNTKFILCTVPVTPNNSDSGNALREYFSDKIRTEYASQGIVFDLADWESRNAARQLELSGGYRELNAAWDIGDGGHPNNAGSDMLAYELLTQLASLAEGLNVVEGSHTFGGLTQTGSLVVGNLNVIEGSHTLTGLTQSGELTNTPPARTVEGTHTLTGLTQTGSITVTITDRIISGSHTLGGLIQTGSIDMLPIVFGSHTLSGLSMSGNLLNSTPIIIRVVKNYEAQINYLLNFETIVSSVLNYETEV